ncbi:pyridoxamine 5'-phosphate oxidase family protein [Jiangella sp. DSM 45060]|uniref:pyridoxamine 5'-phosphate oxidase family protein n=1 Tax=Jiangella sp. DSM 45060 TaxID=1798224 RepID=UPI000879FADE|nr:pyridoxamine 5'-phosphate oxidase family protein [Jiangella sp. DSM 45060]SDT05143.1 Pyridoxamine 5'-phosphate oxidase [Jiangella sp. DSM 45060]
MTAPPTLAPRPLAERRDVARHRLSTHFRLWLATGRDGHGAHLIPVSFVLDGEQVVMATFERSRTMANLRAHPRARLALGDTDDVVTIDGDVSIVEVADVESSVADRYALVSHDPRQIPGFRYLYLRPDRVQVWNGFHEFGGRTVMLGGAWLDEPVD